MKPKLCNFCAYRTKLLRNEERIDEKDYLTDALSRETVSFIERSSNSPFFIYLAYNAPHGPLQATEKYLKNIRISKIREEKPMPLWLAQLMMGWVILYQL